jgi:hypothetical protein
MHPDSRREDLDPSLAGLVKLNELGRDGWEVFDIEVNRHVWRDPDNGNAATSAWTEKTIWLKRPVG